MIPGPIVVDLGADPAAVTDAAAGTRSGTLAINRETLVRQFQTRDDLKVFLIALLDAEREGKRFLFRTAASFVKVYGFVEDKGLLTREDFFGSTGGNVSGGHPACAGSPC